MHPKSAAVLCNFSNFSATSWLSSLVINPAIGNAKESSKSPSTIAKPPSLSIKQLTAFAMSSLFVPTTTILWESWATEEAIAPFLRLNPVINPLAIEFPP